MDIDIPVDIKFQCKGCGTIIEHNYTQQDILNLKQLDLTCQKCGKTDSIETSKLIEMAKEEAIKEIGKNFNLE